MNDDRRNRPSSIIQATYSDLKVVKTRKVAQLIFEIPLEQFNEAMAVLGGAPLPDSEVWVAIARLNDHATAQPTAETGPSRFSDKPAQDPSRPNKPEKPDKPRPEANQPHKTWFEQPPVVRAAMRCKDVRFQQWLHGLGRIPEPTLEEAVAYAKRVSGGSRANLGSSGFEAQTAAWEVVDHKYHEFLLKQRDEAAR
jgi:hypothetical protein